MKTRKVWISVQMLDNSEQLRMFDSFDEIDGLFDYTACVTISETTYKKLKTGDYYAKKFGRTIRAYC